jgi:transcriptional regulator with XRE-family HTH domain
MTDHPSPTVRARRLRRELRKLREERGLTLQQTAELSECAFNASTVGRWEIGERVPRQADLRVLLDIYQVVGAQRQAILTLAREAKLRGWWHPHREMLKDGFGVYVGLESEAAAVYTFQSQMVPGLLQTEDYTRAVVCGIRMNEQVDDLEEKVMVRRVRQELLTRKNPLRLWVVLDEAVLRRHVGGVKVMKEQLEHLVELGGRPNVTIQVLSYHSGAHAAMEGPFYTLEFPDSADPGVVYLEQATSGLALESEDEIRRYTLMFGNLTAKALTPEASESLITRIAEEHR